MHVGAYVQANVCGGLMIAKMTANTHYLFPSKSTWICHKTKSGSYELKQYCSPQWSALTQERSASTTMPFYT